MEKNIIDNFNYLSDRVNFDTLELFNDFFKNVKKTIELKKFMEDELDIIDFLNQNILDNILSNMFNKFNNLIISTNYKNKISKYFDNLNKKNNVCNKDNFNDKDYFDSLDSLVNENIDEKINNNRNMPKIIFYKLNPYDNFYNENEINDYDSFDDELISDISSEDEDNKHIEE